jgi:hypothetical protein
VAVDDAVVAPVIDRHTQHEALRKDLAADKPEPPSTQFQSFKLPKVREAAKPSIAHIPFGIPRKREEEQT